MSTYFPPLSMRQEGPDYEALFTKMQTMNGANPEEAKLIVRYLRFFKDTDVYETYLAHYLPQLPAELAREFKVTETVVGEVTVKEVEEKVKEEPKTETPSIPVAPKKRGRPSSK
jgi:hypothetical protein